jgi:16S rRNA processing protein RimM
VVVQPLTDFVDRFHDLGEVLLESETANRFTVMSVRIHRNSVLMRFDGIDSRTAAEELVGRFVSVTKADLVDLPESTFFQFDIIGMQVYSEDGRLLGTIAEIIPMPANDLWRVGGEVEFLLPAIAQVIVKVDTKERKVIVRLMEGLIESQ